MSRLALVGSEDEGVGSVIDDEELAVAAYAAHRRQHLQPDVLLGHRLGRSGHHRRDGLAHGQLVADQAVAGAEPVDTGRAVHPAVELEGGGGRGVGQSSTSTDLNRDPTTPAKLQTRPSDPLDMTQRGVASNLSTQRRVVAVRIRAEGQAAARAGSAGRSALLALMNTAVTISAITNSRALMKNVT